MKIIYKSISTIVVILTLFTEVFAQQDRTVTGTVIDLETHEKLAGVNILIKGTVYGTVTNVNGEFILQDLDFPVVLSFSYVGFKMLDLTIEEPTASLSIGMEPSPLLGQEIIVSASRLEESILKSPVAIEKLDLRAIRESPAPGFYDALENVKGVQMTTSSLTFKVPNTRGFNIPNNFRFMQLVDGVDMQAATLGVPLGNAIGPTELDIESVEITPGAASALYGMNAINGMANLQTKSPFLYPGLSVYQKTGVNHVDGKDRDPSLLTESAVRYAKVFKDKFAFKINVSYLRGTDWLSNNRTDQNPNTLVTANPSFSELSGPNNQAYDGWTSYGNENNNAVTIGNVFYEGKNQTFLVRRTGYQEGDLTNKIVQNVKADASLHYRLNKNVEISYAYRYGKMDGVFQRGNKIQLNNVVVQNHKVEIKGPAYFIRGYVSLENTGDSYNLKPLSDNLQLTHLSNNAWRDKFKTALQNELDGGTELTTAMEVARTVADDGRYLPGTSEFENLKNTIIRINNWDHGSVVSGAPATGGAWLRQNSRMYHTEGQWNLSKYVKVVDLLVGADARIYEVIPDGNNFVDFSRPLEERNLPASDGSYGNNIYYKKYGAFAQVTKLLLNENLKLTGSLRFDHNLDFSPKLNPRVAVVYTLASNHNFRASYQNGFRFPALFEALSFVNNGNVRRVGGLEFINDGLGYLDNSYTLASVNQFNAMVNKQVDNGSSLEDAALANSQVLMKAALKTTQPERINSVEVGYKGLLFNNSLTVDVDVYASRYDGFLGQVEVSVPTSGNVGSEEAVLDMLATNRSKQTRYRVFTNAKNSYVTYGIAAGANYNFVGTYVVSANVNYNNISENKDPDVFLTAFNTPKWNGNVSFGNRRITERIGYNVVWRWQQAFFWESPLANGAVPAYQTVDAQITYKIPALFANVKIGGSNVFNNRYFQYAAGPNIGALYYITLTFDGWVGKSK